MLCLCVLPHAITFDTILSPSLGLFYFCGSTQIGYMDAMTHGSYLCKRSDRIGICGVNYLSHFVSYENEEAVEYRCLEDCLVYFRGCYK